MGNVIDNRRMIKKKQNEKCSRLIRFSDRASSSSGIMMNDSSINFTVSNAFQPTLPLTLPRFLFHYFKPPILLISLYYSPSFFRNNCRRILSWGLENDKITKKNNREKTRERGTEALFPQETLTDSRNETNGKTIYCSVLQICLEGKINQFFKINKWNTKIETIFGYKFLPGLLDRNIMMDFYSIILLFQTRKNFWWK